MPVSGRLASWHPLQLEDERFVFSRTGRLSMVCKISADVPANEVHEGRREAKPKAGRVLMFSGGRDSTLAALRWAAEGSPMVLATVSSDHLQGIGRVEARLREMAPSLAPETRWVQVRQPTDLRTDTSFYEKTCLPCHHAYVVVSAVLAKLFAADRLAFGYATYQSQWPEQTPVAIEALRSVLRRHRVSLELPVHDLESKEDAAAELAARGMSPAAMEQKCLRQVMNVALDPQRLRAQVALWEAAIDASLKDVESVELEVLVSRDVGSFT